MQAEFNFSEKLFQKYKKSLDLFLCIIVVFNQTAGQPAKHKRLAVNSLARRSWGPKENIMAVIARLKGHRNKSPKAHTVNNLSAVISSFNMRGRERMMLTAFRKSGF